ncbi:MAG: dTDP-4-dehydrorhamnose reductase [Oscillospiraceae bacterium]|nr:dTDP-4-dehydrorhamnose reductase [Oscillospiraceae bacterium]
MNMLITGAQGQLGRDVLAEAAKRGWTVTGVDIADFDLIDRAATHTALAEIKPQVVIHCAAYTAVDRAESEPAQAFAVNENGTRHVAEYCAEHGAWMIYVSTDYVFDGSGTRAWEVDDTPAPCNVYGKSKLAGEQALREICPQHMIVRTSWVFGSHGANFVKTMLRLGSERASVNVVADQVGAPTYTVDLARLLCDMAANPKAGIYHASNAGECSWADFAREILSLARSNCVVNDIPSSEYPTPAMRPMNSRLSPKALIDAGYEILPPWQDALARMLG